jgi:hypothetical protein
MIVLHPFSTSQELMRLALGSSRTNDNVTNEA